MNLRAFLKGDSKLLSASKELEKHKIGPSFAAPKRTYPKPNTSINKASNKTIDENRCPTDDVLTKTRPQDDLSGISEISVRSRQARVLDDLKPSNNGKVGEYRKEKILEDDNGPNIVIRKELPDTATRNLKFTSKIASNSKENQPKAIKQDTDAMIVSLIEEIDRLNGLLLEKINENEEMKLRNISLEKKILELEKQEQDGGMTRRKSLGKNIIENIKGKYPTHETLYSEEDSKGFEGRVYCNTARIGQNKLKNPDKYNNFIGGDNAEKKSIQKDKSIDLVQSLDMLNQSLSEKERENSILSEEVSQWKKNFETVSQKLVQQNQVTEKLRNELMNSHAQNQELNQKLLALKSNNAAAKVTTISFSRVDSPQAHFSHQEISEWQKKYEFIKSDNERLIKIVEENHKIIQNFKDIFRELEERHYMNFEELRKEYDTKFKEKLEKNESKVYQLGVKDETLPRFSTNSKANSSNQSKGFYENLNGNRISA